MRHGAGGGWKAPRFWPCGVPLRRCSSSRWKRAAMDFWAFFAVLATIGLLEYWRGHDRRWLWTLGISVALGVYTVPGFLFFAGPLMLLLWLVERSRVTFFAGVLTAAAILLLYAPLLLQVFSRVHRLSSGQGGSRLREPLTAWFVRSNSTSSRPMIGRRGRC